MTNPALALPPPAIARFFALLHSALSQRLPSFSISPSSASSSSSGHLYLLPVFFLVLFLFLSSPFFLHFSLSHHSTPFVVLLASFGHSSWPSAPYVPFTPPATAYDFLVTNIPLIY
ncbi:predicted protein [Histoplasma capsulatum var. duboisii H88]|uniref:Predicted protein n=1 Tax=Ajellomyces capsulatus (strain H88) TaxID=544711 RepID=F0UVK6_AJEC8|nr:predicted protein [Histoplasma capsulatum var. duboisii H88]